MAWAATMTQLLRAVIYDLGSTSYTDARLQTLLINAAQLINSEMDFSTTYTVDIINETLSPDPTLTATKDDDFFNLNVLKAACLVDQGTYRTEIAMAGLTAKLGPAVLQTSGRAGAFKDLLEVGACGMYKIARDDFMFGNGNVCKAILSPFVGNNFDPQSIGGDDYNLRARF